MELYMTDTGDGGELSLLGGDIEGCDTFYSAIYISLFGGNAYYNVYEDYETNNDFENSLYETITKQNLKNVETTGKNALKWLIDTGAADTVEVSAYGDSDERINVDITVTAPNNISYLYGIVWENQKAVLKAK